jgi:hypothetical protein
VFLSQFKIIFANADKRVVSSYMYVEENSTFSQNAHAVMGLFWSKSFKNRSLY